MYFDAIGNFQQWCEDNYLNLNVKKTKEMIIDFSTSAHDIVPVTINAEHVESVHEYKYLGNIIDDKLDGVANVKKVCKKAKQRLYFLRKLRQINVDSTIMNLFYNSVIQSVVGFCIICWYGGLLKIKRC